MLRTRFAHAFPAWTYDAIGVRMTELPITPQRVLEALARKREQDEG